MKNLEETDLKFEKNSDGTPATLSLRKIRQLLDYCLKNAQQLYDGARLLFEHKMYQGSILLSILAIEELGKRRLLCHFVWVADNLPERKKWWNKYRSHKEKLGSAMLPFIIIHRAKNNKPIDYISQWLTKAEETESKAYCLDQIKQLVTYVNVLEGYPVAPGVLANRNLASKILKVSRQCLDYHVKNEPTQANIETYKIMRRERKEGETIIDFWYRQHLNKQSFHLSVKL